MSITTVLSSIIGCIWGAGGEGGGPGTPDSSKWDTIYSYQRTDQYPTHLHASPFFCSGTTQTLDAHQTS